MRGPARQLIVETARYWESRCVRGADGAAHLPHVIGPDEYHVDVDDNAYTNLMARWNLRRAVEFANSAEEAARWDALAGALVDGYDPATGRHEQFVGYYQLKSLLVAELGTPPLAADLLLGSRAVAATQIVKQPDVLMAHHLLGDQMPAGSLAADLDFYLPRTAGGSSLSPAIVACLLARAGRPDEALPHFELAATLDLDDLTGMSSSGLHLGTLGGVWQALLFGFAGVSVRDGAVILDPQLPGKWQRLSLRFRCLRRRIELTIDGDLAQLRASEPVAVGVRGSAAGSPATRATLRRTPDGWEVRG